MKRMWSSWIVVLEFVVQREQWLTAGHSPQKKIYAQQKGFFLHCALTDWLDSGKGIIAAILHTDMVKHNEMIKVEGMDMGWMGSKIFQQQQQQQQQQPQPQPQQQQQQQQQGIVYQVATLVWSLFPHFEKTRPWDRWGSFPVNLPDLQPEPQNPPTPPT